MIFSVTYPVTAAYDVSKIKPSSVRSVTVTGKNYSTFQIHTPAPDSHNGRFIEDSVASPPPRPFLLSSLPPSFASPPSHIRNQTPPAPDHHHTYPHPTVFFTPALKGARTYIPWSYSDAFWRGRISILGHSHREARISATQQEREGGRSNWNRVDAYAHVPYSRALLRFISRHDVQLQVLVESNSIVSLLISSLRRGSFVCICTVIARDLQTRAKIFLGFLGGH